MLDTKNNFKKENLDRFNEFLNLPSLKASEVARVCRVKTATVIKWKYKRPIKGPTPYKVGGQYRYDPIEVVNYARGIDVR